MEEQSWDHQAPSEHRMTEWPNEASDWRGWDGRGLGTISGTGQGQAHHRSVGAGKHRGCSIRTGQTCSQGCIPPGKDAEPLQTESLAPKLLLSSQAALWAWGGWAGQAAAQAAWALWEQTRPSAGSLAWRSITLHY